MKIAIIALLISLAALGLAGFATARTFNESHPAPSAVESQWSEAECADAINAIKGAPEVLCRGGGQDCDAYLTMLRAIAENCP